MLKQILYSVGFGLSTIGITLAQSDDIFDKQNSIKYAQYLVEKGDYKQAAIEYSRLLKLEIDNDSLRLETIRLFQKAYLYDSVAYYLKGYESKHLAFEREYVNLLIKLKKWDELHHFVNISSFTENEKQITKLHELMQQGHWKKAQVQLENVAIEPLSKVIDYNRLVEKGIKLPHRSIVLAITMSAIVPGLGKVYGGAPWEGLSTFVITGFLAFSAYRGFIQKEEASVPGWLYGAGLIGFYAGNIYGTIKQINKFNQMHKQKLKADVEELIY